MDQPPPPGAGRLTRMAKEWNVKLHYDARLAECVPASATTVLDVGCGDGSLAQR